MLYKIGAIQQQLFLLVLIVFILLGTYLRFETAKYTQIDDPINHDAQDYAAYAYNIKFHGVYSRDMPTKSKENITPTPDATRSPGYPIFLSFIYNQKLSTFIEKTVYFQTFLSCLTLIIVAFLATSIFNKLAALFIILLTALSPHLVTSSTYILTESLFTFLLFSGLFCAIKAQEKNNFALLAVASAILALGALTKPTLQFFIIFMCLFFLFNSPRAQRPSIIIFTLGVFISIYSLWLIRNMIVLGEFSDPTLLINTLHHGMYPYFMYNNEIQSIGYPYRFDPNAAYISASLINVLSTITSNFINQPIEYITWYLSKPIPLFQWQLIQGIDIFIYRPLTSTYFSENSIFSFTSNILKTLHQPLVWLSFIGAGISFAPRKLAGLSEKQLSAVRLLALLYLYFILIHIVGAPFPRYSIPIRPVTYILAVLSIHVILHQGNTYLKSRFRPTGP